MKALYGSSKGLYQKLSVGNTISISLTVLEALFVPKFSVFLWGMAWIKFSSFGLHLCVRTFGGDGKVRADCF